MYDDMSPFYAGKVQQDLVDPNIKSSTNSINHKARGIDVRGSISWSLQYMSMLETNMQATIKNNNDKVSIATNRFDEAISGVTTDSEIKDSRVNAYGKTFKTLSERLNDEQNNQLSISQVVGGDDSEHTLEIIGLTATSPHLHYEQIGNDVENDKITGGFETIRNEQIGWEEIIV